MNVGHFGELSADDKGDAKVELPELTYLLVIMVSAIG